MSYGLILHTAPAAEPITKAEAMTHMRLDSLAGTDLDHLDILIKAAREYCEAYQNRSYITQTWQMVLDHWPYGNCIELARPPLLAAPAPIITYIDSDGVTHTMAAADYIVDIASFAGRIVLGYSKTWPSETLRPGAGITIEYAAGYGLTGASIPFMARTAMLLLISHWWEHREAVLAGTISKEIEFAMTALLNMDRVF